MDLANLEQIFGALNNARARYLVVGGLAVVAHGYVRYTNDVDLVVQLDEDNVRRSMQALKDLGYRAKVPVDPAAFATEAIRESWIREKQMVVFQLVSDRFPRVPIDVFVREPFDVGVALESCVWMPISPTLKLPVVSRHDLLAMKRSANRPKDLLDIAYLEKLESHGHEQLPR